MSGDLMDRVGVFGCVVCGSWGHASQHCTIDGRPLTFVDLARSVFPGISDQRADFLLWSRTPFPFGGIADVMSALRSDKEMLDQGYELSDLCEMCPELNSGNDYLCDSCRDSFNRARLGLDSGAAGAVV